jgi:hypothetical protein
MTYDAHSILLFDRSSSMPPPLQRLTLDGLEYWDCSGIPTESLVDISVVVDEPGEGRRMEMLLARCTNAKQIRARCYVEDDEAAPPPPLALFPFLKSLNISDAAPFWFPRYIEAPNLETLTIHQRHWERSWTEEITPPTWPKLTTLELYGMTIIPEILSLLDANPSLTSISMQYCDHVAFLFKALLPPATDGNCGARNDELLVVPKLQRLRTGVPGACDRHSSENWAEALLEVILSRPALFVDCHAVFWQYSPALMRAAEEHAKERLLKVYY